MLGTGAAAALGGAVSSTITGIGSLFGAKKRRKHEQSMADRAYKENREMADYQYSKDLEQWNRANRYNSPDEQMKRLKEAGLNPNLVYENGAAQSNAASQLPKYNSPTADYSGVSSGAQGIEQVSANLGDTLHQYYDLKTKAASIDHLNAQKDLTEARDAMVVAQTHGETYSNVEKTYKAKLAQDKIDSKKTGVYSFQENQLKLDKLLQEGALIKQNKRIKKKEAQFWETNKAARFLAPFLRR